MAVGCYEEIQINYPEDITKLKEAIPEIRCLDDSIIDVLYADFSQSWFCAGWMSLDIESFKMYLFTNKTFAGDK